MKYAFIFYKAAVICGCIGVIAEVSYEALKKRYDQGWVREMIDDVEALIHRIREAKKNGEVQMKRYFLQSMFPHQINLQIQNNLTKKHAQNINMECAQRDEYDTWDIN